MPTLPRSQQAGYVLVTVLILTLIASMVVFVSLRQNHLLERMGGNQQKMINANLAAGRGVAESLTLIKNRLAAGASAADIQTALVRELTGVYAITNVSYAAPRLSFISKGMYQDAVAYKKANFTLSTGTYPFSSGLVACDSLTLSGSGNIASYDPAKGVYNKNTNNNANADVDVLNAGSNIVDLSGQTAINGDVTINGSAKMSGSSPINGLVSVAKNLELTGGSTSANAASVGGNLVLNPSTSVIGHANVVGNVTADWGAKIGSLTYGGNFIHSDPNFKTTQNSLVNSTPSAPVMPSSTCDPLNIASKVPWKSNSINTITSAGKSDVIYNFTPSTGQGLATSGGSSIVSMSPDTATVLDSSKSVYYLDSLDINNSSLYISGGDVTIIVNNNFSISGGVKGQGVLGVEVATGSSLTIYVKGKTQLGSGGEFLVHDAGASANGNKSPISIYSANTSTSNNDPGVSLSGAFKGGYAAIYAPLARVAVAAGSAMSGAIRGKDLDLSGNGGLYYDESLGKSAVGGSSGSVKLYAIQDYYP